MADAGKATIKVSITGELGTILDALALLTAALSAHGHAWTEEERAAVEAAIRICKDETRREVAPG